MTRNPNQSIKPRSCNFMTPESFEDAVQHLLAAVAGEFEHGTSDACHRTVQALRSIDTTVSRELCQPIHENDEPCPIPEDITMLLQKAPETRCLAAVLALYRHLQWHQSTKSLTPVSEIIGPTSLVRHPDFRLGLFLLVPNIDYADHAHQADEVYVVLAGHGDWSLDRGPYEEKTAGDVIDIPSMTIHAMRTAAEPVLTLFSWTGDVSFDNYRFC